MLKNVLWREAPSKVVPENSGGVCQYMAECPKGSDRMCMGFDNRLSRSSTLIDFQDV